MSIDCYICPKEAYNISNVSYSPVNDISTLVNVYYDKRINDESAHLFTVYGDHCTRPFISIERDYLLGKALIPSLIKELQGQSDRLEISLLPDSDSNTLLAKYIPSENCSKSFPFKLFDYEEYITAAKSSDKELYYKKWKKVLSDNESVWCKLLIFVANNNNKTKREAPYTISDVIESYPGAVSPIGIRMPIDDTSYIKAQSFYVESNFEQAKVILKESIDAEGISAQSLNLLGASYRYLKEPATAMSYFLLCLKLDPYAPYVIGNIILSLQDMSFSNVKDVANELSFFATDKWSKDIINSTK